MLLLAMRGAGQTDIIVYSDQVGVSIDDFIVPHVQTQLLDIFDIEQVEVLRGPQVHFLVKILLLEW